MPDTTINGDLPVGRVDPASQAMLRPTRETAMQRLAGRYCGHHVRVCVDMHVPRDIPLAFPAVQEGHGRNGQPFLAILHQ